MTHYLAIHLVQSNISNSQYLKTRPNPIFDNLKASLNSVDLTQNIPKSGMVEHS